jgi:hypothetical protein
VGSGSCPVSADGHAAPAALVRFGAVVEPQRADHSRVEDNDLSPVSRVIGGAKQRSLLSQLTTLSVNMLMHRVPRRQ